MIILLERRHMQWLTDLCHTVHRHMQWLTGLCHTVHIACPTGHLGLPILKRNQNHPQKEKTNHRYVWCLTASDTYQQKQLLTCHLQTVQHHTRASITLGSSPDDEVSRWIINISLHAKQWLWSESAQPSDRQERDTELVNRKSVSQSLHDCVNVRAKLSLAA